MNESDSSVFAKRYGGSSQCYGVIWAIISLALAACGIIVSQIDQRFGSGGAKGARKDLDQCLFCRPQAGLAVFKDSFSEQAARGKDFLPTRLL